MCHSPLVGLITKLGDDLRIFYANIHSNHFVRLGCPVQEACMQISITFWVDCVAHFLSRSFAKTQIVVMDVCMHRNKWTKAVQRTIANYYENRNDMAFAFFLDLLLSRSRQHHALHCGSLGDRRISPRYTACLNNNKVDYCYETIKRIPQFE